MCCCIPRKMVPLDATCHHVATGVTPRQNRTVKPTTCGGRLCAFYSLLTRRKTDRSQTFSHGRLCAIGYISVGLSQVRFHDLYNRPQHNRPSLKEDGRFYMNAVGFLQLCIVCVVGFI